MYKIDLLEDIFFSLDIPCNIQFVSIYLTVSKTNWFVNTFFKSSRHRRLIFSVSWGIITKEGCFRTRDSKGLFVCPVKVVCSVGDSPARERNRNPVAWLAMWKETELLESNNKAA